MPLRKINKANRAYNMRELTQGRVGPTRRKAIRTIARRRGISTKEAKVIQALAITRGKTKKKGRKRKK